MNISGPKLANGKKHLTLCLALTRSQAVNVKTEQINYRSLLNLPSRVNNLLKSVSTCNMIET